MDPCPTLHWTGRSSHLVPVPFRRLLDTGHVVLDQIASLPAIPYVCSLAAGLLQSSMSNVTGADAKDLPLLDGVGRRALGIKESFTNTNLQIQATQLKIS